MKKVVSRNFDVWIVLALIAPGILWLSLSVVYWADALMRGIPLIAIGFYGRLPYLHEWLILWVLAFPTLAFVNLYTMATESIHRSAWKKLTFLIVFIIWSFLNFEILFAITDLDFTFIQKRFWNILKDSLGLLIFYFSSYNIVKLLHKYKK